MAILTHIYIFFRKTKIYFELIISYSFWINQQNKLLNTFIVLFSRLNLSIKLLFFLPGVFQQGQEVPKVQEDWVYIQRCFHRPEQELPSSYRSVEGSSRRLHHLTKYYIVKKISFVHVLLLCSLKLDPEGHWNSQECSRMTYFWAQ